MKKFIIAAALTALVCLTASAQEGRKIYNKYSSEKHVSAVYISPAMFRIIGKTPDLDLGEGEINVSKIIQTLTGMYVISSEDPKVYTNLIKDADSYVKSGKYELLLEAKEDDEIVKMYTVGTDKLITGFVLLSIEDDEVDFICFEGQISRDDFEDLIAHAASD